MNYDLDAKLLKTGEIIVVNWVIAPDFAWETEIRALLAHKPEKYLSHVNDVLHGITENDTRFYVARLNESAVGIALLAMKQHMGHIGHVYVREEHRGKGVGRVLMNTLMDDFVRHDGYTLFLGTEYGSTAYRLYLDLGFRDYQGIPDGRMQWQPQFVFFSEEMAFK